VLLFFVIAGFHFLIRRRLKPTGQSGWPYLQLELVFLLSLAPAVITGVSTRTSEGDRLLYFPSCFLCLLISALLFSLVRKARIRLLLLVVLIAGSAVFIQQNNRRWVFAAETVSAIVDTLKTTPAHQILLINAPDEWEGAFIFRNNFSSLLLMEGIDTNKVVVGNYLLRLEYLGIKGNIFPVVQDSGLFIYPASRIISGKHQFRFVNLQTGFTQTYDKREDRVYYWDKLHLKRLILE
jgi:hypothetical protein